MIKPRIGLLSTLSLLLTLVVIIIPFAFSSAETINCDGVSEDFIISAATSSSSSSSSSSQPNYYNDSTMTNIQLITQNCRKVVIDGINLFNVRFIEILSPRNSSVIIKNIRCVDVLSARKSSNAGRDCITFSGGDKMKDIILQNISRIYDNHVGVSRDIVSLILIRHSLTNIQKGSKFIVENCFMKALFKDCVGDVSLRILYVMATIEPILENNNNNNVEKFENILVLRNLFLHVPSYTTANFHADIVAVIFGAALKYWKYILVENIKVFVEHVQNSGEVTALSKVSVSGISIADGFGNVTENITFHNINVTVLDAVPGASTIFACVNSIRTDMTTNSKYSISGVPLILFSNLFIDVRSVKQVVGPNDAIQHGIAFYLVILLEKVTEIDRIVLKNSKVCCDRSISRGPHGVAVVALLFYYGVFGIREEIVADNVIIDFGIIDHLLSESYNRDLPSTGVNAMICLASSHPNAPAPSFLLPYVQHISRILIQDCRIHIQKATSLRSFLVARVLQFLTKVTDVNKIVSKNVSIDVDFTSKYSMGDGYHLGYVQAALLQSRTSIENVNLFSSENCNIKLKCFVKSDAGFVWVYDVVGHIRNITNITIRGMVAENTAQVRGELNDAGINLIGVDAGMYEIGGVYILDSSIRMYESKAMQLTSCLFSVESVMNGLKSTKKDSSSSSSSSSFVTSTIHIENSVAVLENSEAILVAVGAFIANHKIKDIASIRVKHCLSLLKNTVVYVDPTSRYSILQVMIKQSSRSGIFGVGFLEQVTLPGEEYGAPSHTIDVLEVYNCSLICDTVDTNDRFAVGAIYAGNNFETSKQVLVRDATIQVKIKKCKQLYLDLLKFRYATTKIQSIIVENSKIISEEVADISSSQNLCNLSISALSAKATFWRPVPSEYLSPSKNGIGSMLIRNIDIQVQRKFSSSSTSSDSENNNNFAVAALDLSFPLLPQSQAVQISDVYIFDQTTTTGSRSSCTASACSLLRLGDGLALSEGAFRISSSRFSLSGSLVAAFESSFASSSSSSGSSSAVSFTFDDIFIASPSSSLSSAPDVDTAIFSRLIYTSSNDVSQFGNQQQQILRLHDLHQTSWNFECTRPWKSRLISTFKNLASETAKINFPCFLSRTASPNKTLSKSLAVTQTVSISPLFVVPFVSPLRKTAKTTSDVNTAFSFTAAAAAATAARNRYIVASMSRYGEGECGSRQDVDDVPEIATSPLQIRISGKASWAGGTMIGNLVFCFLLLFVFFLGFVVYWKFLKKHSSSSSSAADGEGEENMEYDRFGREISPPAPPLPPFEIIVIQSKMGQGIIFVTTMLLEPTLSAALALITLPEIPVMWRLIAAAVVGLILFLLIRSSYRYLYQRNIVEVFKKPDARQVAKWQNKDEEAGVVVGFLRKQFRCWLVAEGEWEIIDDDDNDVGNEDARNNSSSSRNSDNNNNSNRNNNNRRNKKKRRREVSDADRLAFLLALPALEGFTDRAPRFLVLDTAVLLAFVVASFLGNVIGGSKGCVATAVVLLIALILHFACTLYLRPNVERVNRYGIPLVSIAHISCVIALIAGVSEKDVGALLAAVSFLTLPLMILTFIAGCLAPIVGAALRMSRGKRRHVTSSSSRNDNSRSGLFSSLMDDDDQDEEDQDPRNFSMRARRDERRRKEERENRNNNNNNNGDVELESRRRFSNYNDRNSSSSSAQQHRFFHHQQQQQHHQLDDDLLRPQRVKIERLQQKPQQEDSLSSRRLDSASQIMARFKEIQQQQQQQSRSSSPRNNRNHQHPQIPNRSTSPSSSSRSQSRSQRVDTTSSNNSNNYRRNNHHDSDQDDNDLHILDSRYNNHQHQRSNRSSSTTRRNDDFSSSPSASAAYSSNSNRPRQHQQDYSHRKEEEERSSPRSQSRSRSNGATAVAGRNSSDNKNQHRDQRSSSTSRGRR